MFKCRALVTRLVLFSCVKLWFVKTISHGGQFCSFYSIILSPVCAPTPVLRGAQTLFTVVHPQNNCQSKRDYTFQLIPQSSCGSRGQPTAPIKPQRHWASGGKKNHGICPMTIKFQGNQKLVCAVPLKWRDTRFLRTNAMMLQECVEKLRKWIGSTSDKYLILNKLVFETNVNENTTIMFGHLIFDILMEQSFPCSLREKVKRESDKGIKVMWQNWENKLGSSGAELMSILQV